MATATTTYPVCESCGKSTRSHKRPRYCAECGASVEQFAQRFNAPEAAPIRLYRFALGLYEDAVSLYTLALIPARFDDEAFDKGCKLMPADAPTLARRSWPGEPEGEPAGAFFTVQELDGAEDAAMYAAEMPEDVQTILGRFGQ